jgi:mannose-1-phosphate guanylyltransferase/mannose-6-phosphate isomerase
MIKPVILCGGSGTRLWPLSRQAYPKQFIKLHGNGTMLQDCIARQSGLVAADAIFVCNEEHRFLTAEQIRSHGFNHAGIILAPIPQNTAPAIALAALHAISEGEDPILLILPADHIIKNIDAYRLTIEKASQVCKDGLLTFGIVPSKPETGYGYIRVGEKVNDNEVYHVEAFVEKPDSLTAEKYLKNGDYLWNSGIFMFRAGRYLKELEKFRPDIFEACKKAMEGAKKDLDFIRIGKKAFEDCPAESIDYAIMEKTDQAMVVKMESSWSDIGSWQALWEINNKDEHGNSLKGDAIVHETHNSLVIAESRLVVVQGMDKVAVIETKDALLVTSMDHAQEIKKIVQRLESMQRDEIKQQRQVYRPWGHYDSMDSGDRFQVKRITVKPGAKLSVQMHHHRAEHWVVVSGSAKVRIGEKTILLTENQSAYIPLGETHSLENPGKIPLNIIEVQTGAYLGEDDIVRFEDRYGRIDTEN